MQKIQGWVEAGGTTLVIASAAGTIAQKVQGSFVGAAVAVYLAGTVTLAGIYADNVGTVKANPFTTGGDGTWFFYARNGRYDVKFSGGGLAAPFTSGDVLANDPAVQPVYAADFGLGDLGANINAASAAIGGGTTPGEIWITGYDAGQTLTTPAAWGYDQTVKFVGGGIYTIAATMTGGHMIGIANGSDLGPVQLVAGNGTNLPYMFNGLAYKGSITDVSFDGNQANNPTAGDNITSNLRQLYVRVRSINANRHGWYLTAFSLAAAGGTTFDNCTADACNGSGIRAEGCVDVATRGYTEMERSGQFGIDLFNCPGSRLIGGDFGGNHMGGLNISGTNAFQGGALILVIGNQFGQDYKEDIIINGWDAAGGGYASFGAVIIGNDFWAGPNRMAGAYSAVSLIDTHSNMVCHNNFESVAGTEYKHAISETSPTGHAGANTIGPNACIPPFGGTDYDLIANLSILHAGTGTNAGISNYTELDVQNLGVRGGTRYLGGNFLAANVLQEVFNSNGVIGGVTGSLLAMNLSGVRVCITIDQNGNVGVNTLGIGGAASSDPSIAGRVWSNSGVLVISGAADTPLFPGLGVGATGLFIGGPTGTLHIAELIYALGAPTSGVFSTLLSFAKSGDLQLAALDTSGNFGINGTLGMTPPTSDPSTTGRVWSNGGFVVMSGFNAATARAAVAAAVSGAVTAHTIPLLKLTGGGSNGSITWNADGTITAFTDPT